MNNWNKICGLISIIVITCLYSQSYAQNKIIYRPDELGITSSSLGNFSYFNTSYPNTYRVNTCANTNPNISSYNISFLNTSYSNSSYLNNSLKNASSNTPYPIASHFLISSIKSTDTSQLFSTFILPANFYSCHIGYFCRKEIKFEKATRIPLRFRIGTLQECNRLEGKRY